MMGHLWYPLELNVATSWSWLGLILVPGMYVLFIGGLLLLRYLGDRAHQRGDMDDAAWERMYQQLDLIWRSRLGDQDAYDQVLEQGREQNRRLGRWVWRMIKRERG